MKSVQAVVLDFGNVIINIEPERSFNALSDLMDHKHFSEPVAINVYLRELTSKHECGIISDVLFINGVLKYARLEVQAIDVINAWNAMLLDIPADNLKVLRELKEKYPLYLLSNTNGIHIDYVLRYLRREHKLTDWSSCFNHIMYSHEVKMVKPNVEIYQYTEQVVSQTPESILFVDDRKDNTDAAMSRGWQVICKEPRVLLRETMSDYL